MWHHAQRVCASSAIVLLVLASACARFGYELIDEGTRATIGGAGGTYLNGGGFSGGASGNGNGSGEAGSILGGSGGSSSLNTAGQAAGGVAGGGGSGGSSGSSGSGGADGCLSYAYGGHDYLWCKQPLDWTSAVNDCNGRGMKLARIDDASENTWLTATMFAGASNDNIEWVWLGGSDAAAEGTFVWLDGTVFWTEGTPYNNAYVNWTSGNPSPAWNNTVDCLIIEPNGRWLNSVCDDVHYYACEAY